MTNDERAAYAQRAVDAFWGTQGEEELQTKIGDLLANLRHLCKREGISYDDADKSGRHHFICELIDEDGLAPVQKERSAMLAYDLAAADFIIANAGSY